MANPKRIPRKREAPQKRRNLKHRQGSCLFGLANPECPQLLYAHMHTHAFHILDKYCLPGLYLTVDLGFCALKLIL